MWISCLLALLSDPGETISRAVTTMVQAVSSNDAVAGNSNRATSTSFEVVSDALDVRIVAADCESRLTQLQKTWSDGTVLRIWSPRCVVAVHATRGSYGASAGRGSVSSVGSSLIGIEAGRVTTRRIDLLVERQCLPALSHELTHLVLADLFGGRRLASLGG